jgi:DNA-binding MarR family transcriptional regulator
VSVVEPNWIEVLMDRLVSRIRRLVAATEAYRLGVARAIGVGVTETTALADLSFHGPMTPSALAERLGLASPSVTALADRLEAAGLVVRSPHPLDRRSVFIELSETGAVAVRTMSDLFGADVMRALEAEPPENYEVLERLLERITARLRERARDGDSLVAALGNAHPSGGATP